MTDYPGLLKKYFNVLVHEGGSDLHLSTGAHPTIRVSGELSPMLKEPVLTKEDTGRFLEALVSPELVARFKQNQELDFAFESPDMFRFRGNAFIQRGAVGIVLRLIPKQIMSIKDLNLPDILTSFARKEQGFFLVVGPVGQGKTTTLASLIELINVERMEHIITIEDPIEYIFEPKQSLIDQREVGIDTKDFASALLSAFREDVDVLLDAAYQQRSTDHRPHHRHVSPGSAGPDTPPACRVLGRHFLPASHPAYFGRTHTVL